MLNVRMGVRVAEGAGGTRAPIMSCNKLLAALPAPERGHLEQHLELVNLRPGQVIQESGGRLGHAYFPIDAIVSILGVTANGACGEVATIGNDGMVGLALVLGGATTTTSRAVVQSGGMALRIGAGTLSRQFALLPRLHDLLLQATHVLLIQMSQAAVCNQHHSIEQRLCRWFLSSLDRLPSDEVAATHELVAMLLGVRREGVTEATGRLQRAGLLEHHRGRNIVRDRAGLESRACDCYRLVRDELHRLLPGQSKCAPF